MGNYRNLQVWHRARRLTRRVQVLVSELPRGERARGQQLKSAATSIRYNLAEGCGLNSDPMLAKHVRIALRSANEVQDQLDDLNDENLLGERDQDLPPEVAEIRAMLVGLYRKVTGEVP